MKFLLDTHVLLWVVGDSSRLKPETQRTLADGDNTIFVSVVSLWEIAVKSRIGKLEADVALIAAQLAPASKIQLLGITPRHLIALNNLPIREPHRDPFDHLIIAQAICEDMMLVTQDRNAPLYPVQIMVP
ncbi:MAG TPA: type II toxin-antitoxin system VapC family toxin [Rhodopila sp.]